MFCVFFGFLLTRFFFEQLGLEGKEVKFESPTKSKKVEKIIASPPSTGRVRQSEEVRNKNTELK